MRHGICILPEYPWSQAETLWRRADELGFDHAWTYDHLVWAGLPDSPWHSTFATLTAAAMVTERIRLGTLVTTPNFRHPVTLARDVVTLDDISGGRVLLGVGTGGDRDARLLGEELSRGERSRRFREFVPLLDRCLREDHVDHDGYFYTVVDARNLTPVRTPLVVAGEGPKSMQLAVRYAEGWVTTGPTLGEWAERDAVEQWWAGVAELAERFSEAEETAEPAEPSGEAERPAEESGEAEGPAEESGEAEGPAEPSGEAERPAEESVQPEEIANRPLDRYLTLDASGPAALSSVQFLTEQVGRAAELGFTDVIVHWPRSAPPYQSELGVIEGYMETLR